MSKLLLKILLVAAVLAINLAALHFLLLDGVHGAIFATFFGEDTVYAKEYSDEGFRKITVGMPRNEVMSTIGSPFGLWTNRDASVGMNWSKSHGSNSYRIRALTFSGDKVMGKGGEFLVD